MKPIESVAKFEEAIAAAGIPLPQLTPQVGIDRMLFFYAEVEAEDCSRKSEDMLLFEWGTYNWGDGEHFELALSRQFIETGAEGEPEISQLRLVYTYPKSAASVAFGEGNCWCDSRADLQEFKRFINSNASYVALCNSGPENVALSYTYV